MQPRIRVAFQRFISQNVVVDDRTLRLTLE